MIPYIVGRRQQLKQYSEYSSEYSRMHIKAERRLGKNMDKVIHAQMAEKEL